MKRFFAVLLIIFSILSLTGCNRISIKYDGNAVLKFREKVTQTLTEEETRKVREYLSSAEYTPGQGGCPFDKDISITFDDQVFAIAYDDCNGVWIPATDKYYTISEEGRNYVVSLFKKYVGYFPYP